MERDPGAAGLEMDVESRRVCQVTGGPCVYGGKGMKEAHASLRITQMEWDAMVADFKASLDKFKVPTVEQNELFAIVGTTKADIVVVEESRR
jgi:hemoglobin